MYSQYMSLALKNGLACVFHSVTDGKSDPEQIIKLAEKYPKLPVVYIMLIWQLLRIV